MGITVTRDGEATVIALESQYDSFDDAAINHLSEVLLHQAGAANPALVVLDFAETKFFGSRFVEVAVRAWKRLRQRQGQMALANLNPFCTEVLESARLNQLWSFYPTREAAVAAISGGRG